MNPEVLLHRVSRDGCLDVVVGLAVDEPCLLVHETVSECQPAIGTTRALDFCGHEDAQLVARGIPQRVGRELQADLSGERRRLQRLLEDRLIGLARRRLDRELAARPDVEAGAGGHGDLDRVRLAVAVA